MESKETGGIILAGIDSLVIGFAVDKFLFSEEKRESLVQGKVHAGSKVFGGADSAVSWYGQDLAIRPGGAKGYEWILHNSDLHIAIASEARGGSVYPEIMATFSSAMLWREGPAKAFEMTREWLGRFAVLGPDKVSRADLCADLAMAAPKIDLGSELLCRARSRVDHGMIAVAEHKSGRKRTGYEIGRGNFHARFYDKREELKKSDKDWFEVLWRKGGWDRQSPITRFEFQFRRKVLREFQVETFADLIAQAPDLWKYATEDWCTVREEMHG